MTPKMFDAQLSFDALRKVGTGLGSSGLIVYDEDMCMVKVACLLSAFLASESCGQCVSCNLGCRVITEHLLKFEQEKASADDLEAVRRECQKVDTHTRCYLPTEEAILIRSLLEKFPKEFENHLQAPCRYSRDPVLPQISDFDEATGIFTYATSKKERFEEYMGSTSQFAVSG